MEELNLLDYLVPDIQVYSVIHRSMKKVLRIEPAGDFPIVIGEKKKGARPMAFNRRGSVLRNGTECLLFPDRDKTDWEGYITPAVFKQGEVVKAFTATGEALILIYSRFDRERQLHLCFRSVSETGEILYSEHSKADKFRRTDGYLYAKQIYSKMNIGKFIKEENDE